jgi:hypothetical protein
MNTSIEDVNTHYEGCNAYHFQTTDGLVTCQLHPNHFGFLQNYTNDGNPIELFDITQKEADDGIKLYHHYLIFHQLMNDLLAGTKLPEKEEIQTVVKILVDINQNKFLHWLQFKMSEEETIMASLIDKPTAKKLNNYICEYYWSSKSILTLVSCSFVPACLNGHLKVAKWLISLEPTHGKIDIHATDEETIDAYTCNEYAFRTACENGHLEVAKWLLSLEPTHGKIDIHAGNNYAFKFACFNGHLEIAQWLFSLELIHGKFGSPSGKFGSHSDKSDSSLDNLNIHTSNEFAFRTACGRGHLEVAKWLISLEPTHGIIDIHTDDKFAFRNACKNGHLEVAKWLHSLEPTHGKIDIHTKDEFAFRKACENGHLEVAKWLLSLEPTHGPIDIHVDDGEANDEYVNNKHTHNEYAFVIACANGHLEVVKWLLSLEPTHGKIDIHAENDCAFKLACSCGHLEIAQWLLSLAPTHGKPGSPSGKIDIHAQQE